jgi:hypothetical protein
MSVRTSLLAVVLVLGLVGCGGRTPANTGDGDAGTTADGPYQLDDAGQIVYDDAGNPIPAQQDAAPGQDDGGHPNQDAPVVQQDTGATPGVIQCGQTTCDADTQQCCVSGGGGGGSAACIGLGEDCQGLEIACDGPEDCTDSTAPICCARFGGGGSGVTCTDDCQGQTLCRVDGDCGGGEKCCGSGSFGSISATWCELEEDCPNTNPTQGVPCGNTSCDAPQICCVTFSGATCTAADGCDQGLALACDGPEDCSNGDVCCGDIGMGGGGSECLPAGDCEGGGMGSGVLCHSDADCQNNERCNDVPMVDVRICG